MIHLTSKKLLNLPFEMDMLHHIADLIHIEGPLLTLFKHKSTGVYYLFDWIDRDETYNRWLVYACSFEKLQQYIQQTLSHNALFWEEGNLCYIVEIDRNFDLHNPQQMHKEDLPKEYYPSQEAFFDKIYCPEIQELNNHFAKKVA